MKIFKKTTGNRIHIYFCGIKIASYKNHTYENFERIYARRFDKNLSYKMREQIIQYQFRKRLGYSLNLSNPKTFNEKMQWLKLNHHDQLITTCADKVAVRDYVASKIGPEYLVPCLGTWRNPDDIDFDKLPDKFVLKVNWGSGQNIIVTDKSKLDINKTRAQLREWMQPENNNYYGGLEWSYKNIKPMIIAEQFIEQMDKNLLDYKFFCFNGNPLYVQIDADRFANHSRNIYDMEFCKQNVKYVYPKYDGQIIKPDNFEQMMKLAKILAGDFPFARVDFFNLDGQIKFGEITFYPEAGFGCFTPVDWDSKLGDLLVLPK